MDKENVVCSCVCVYIYIRMRVRMCVRMRVRRKISHNEEKKCVICMDLVTFRQSKVKSETITVF